MIGTRGTVLGSLSCKTRTLQISLGERKSERRLRTMSAAVAAGSGRRSGARVRLPCGGREGQGRQGGVPWSARRRRVFRV